MTLMEGNICLEKLIVCLHELKHVRYPKYASVELMFV
jgi:hypothetical protein